MAKIRKFPQHVFAEMTRFSDQSGRWYLDEKSDCFLVRNKTRIVFSQSDHLIGTVIMTNPGSYGLNEVEGWEEFRSGKGEIQQLTGYGYPDPTMRNIIKVVQEAFKCCGKLIPEGFIDILNISNAVCPKGQNAVEYHNELNLLLKRHNYNNHLLESREVHENLSVTFDKSPFVILGFVQKSFDHKVNDILKSSIEYSSKIVIAQDRKNWPSHPRRWGIEKDLAEKAISNLAQVIEKKYA